MAKSGIISATSTNVALKSVADSDPVTLSLAGTAIAALKQFANKGFAVINTKTREVFILDRTAGNATKVGNYVGPILAAEASLVRFEKDDDTSSSSPMTATVDITDGPSGHVEDIVVAAKPSFTVQSIANAIEDKLMLSGFDGVIVIDQETETVKAYVGTGEKIDEADPTQFAAADAKYVQTLASSATKNFGE
jgi:hypothetical protein